LAAGLANGERLMYVADDPEPRLWPLRFVSRAQLVVASTTDVYGPEHTVVAASQREIYAMALDEALRDGYSGLRVIADNTSLVDGAQRFAAWLRWEQEADAFMSENPMTALCSFDRTRVDRDSLRALVGAHQSSVFN
jgi:hypothetical protein